MACRKGAEAVILDKKGRVLLQKRSDVKIWTLPGGGIKKGESPQAAAVREAKEETNLDVTSIRFVGKYSTHYMNYCGVAHVFLCRIKGGKLQKNYESEKLAFFEMNKMPKALLYLHRKRIRDAIAGKEGIEAKQKVSIWKVLKNFNFNPITVWQLGRFSVRKVI